MKSLSFALFLPLVLAACGGPLKYSVPSTSRAPGADAKIVADVAPGQGQTRLEMAVANLAPPARIAEKATAYVAWYRKNSSATWSRVGGLAYDEGDRQGKLSGSVPEIAFDLAVTAEQSDSPASPSPDVILAQRVED